MPAQGTTARGVLGAGLGLLGFSALAGLLVTVMVAPAIAVTGMTASNSLNVFNDMPDYITIEEQNQVNTFVVTLADGSVQPVAEVYNQNREEVDLENVDEDLKWAAIDGEDRRFYEHGGVDAPSLVRAALGQVTNTSESGASTLTMQLVRNILVLRAENDTSLSEEEHKQAIIDATYPDLNRKLKEMKLAIGLEKKYTKEEILEAYLNIVLMGGTTYGVEAGAQRYFGASSADLTPAQAASLLAIVQNPSKIGLNNPENFERNKERRDLILWWMHEQGHLTQEDYDTAVATPVDATTVSSNAPSSGCSAAAPEYRLPCDYALKSILNGEVPSLGATKDEQRAAWIKGGYTVHLSVKPELQGYANGVVADMAPATETRMQLGATVTSVEVGTGRILIMAQNKGFDDTGTADPATHTAVNLTSDYAHGGSKGFQPGSTYKPYVLLAFLNAGHGLNETFNASVRSVPMASFQDSCNGPYGGAPYTFRNDSGESGLYNGIRGTAGSVNSVFVQMGAEVDQCDVAKLAASIGVHRADGKADGSDLFTNPACLVGGCENNIAPLSQAVAYAAIANQGTYCAPIIIDKLVDRDANEIAGQSANCAPSLVSPSVANTATHAMVAVMGGTGSASNPRDGTPYMGKTGTTNDAIHTWMVGSSTRVATSVWVGNIQGKQSMRQISVNGRFGGTLRHAIFKPIAQAIDAHYPGGDFAGPDPALMTGTPVFVPDNLLGMTAEQAKAAIELAKLSYQDGGQVDSDLPVGTVVQTDPAPGSSVPKGTPVTVFTSNGQAAAVPDVVTSAQNFNSARSTLNSAGFLNVSERCEEAEDDDPPTSLNTVVSQDPAAGSVVNMSREITLTVRKDHC